MFIFGSMILLSCVNAERLDRGRNINVNGLVAPTHHQNLCKKNLETQFANLRVFGKPVITSDMETQTMEAVFSCPYGDQFINTSGSSNILTKAKENPFVFKCNYRANSFDGTWKNKQGHAVTDTYVRFMMSNYKCETVCSNQLGDVRAILSDGAGSELVQTEHKMDILVNRIKMTATLKCPAGQILREYNPYGMLNVGFGGEIRLKCQTFNSFSNSQWVFEDASHAKEVTPKNVQKRIFECVDKDEYDAQLKAVKTGAIFELVIWIFVFCFIVLLRSMAEIYHDRPILDYRPRYRHFLLI